MMGFGTWLISAGQAVPQDLCKSAVGRDVGLLLCSRGRVLAADLFAGQGIRVILISPRFPGDGIYCVSVLVFVPSDMSHRIAGADHDLEVMRCSVDRYDLGADWGYAPVRYLSKKLHGCPCR